MTNRQKFETQLEIQLTTLLQTPKYAIARRENTPASLAAKLVEALSKKTAFIDGDAVKAACKILGVKRTAPAIALFLQN